MSSNRRWSIGPFRLGIRTPSMGSNQSETANDGGEGNHRPAANSPVQESGGSTSSCSIVHREELTPTIIRGQGDVLSIAFFPDGEHLVSGGGDGKIRCRQVEDGKEVGASMNAGKTVRNIAVSRDSQWIVSGTDGGRVQIWNAETHEMAKEIQAHGRNSVNAVDISPDATKIVSGSNDDTASVWSCSTGERLLGPWSHVWPVAAAKFSPDGRLIATATWNRHSVRVYDAEDGRLLVDVPIRVSASGNNSLAWASEGGRLFALSNDGNIHRLDVSTKDLSAWAIDSGDAKCLALAKNDSFVAVSVGQSISFWDAKTNEQIGSTDEFTRAVSSMALSDDYNLATGGGKKISLQNISTLLPSTYHIAHDATELEKIPEELIESQDTTSNSSVGPESTIQGLRNELAETRRVADEQQRSMDEIIRSLRSEIDALETTSAQQIEDLREAMKSIRVREKSSSDKIDCLGQTNQELQHKSNSLTRIISAHEQKHECEVMYAQGRVCDAAEALLQMMNAATDDVKGDKFLSNWFVEFSQRCIKALENLADVASITGEHDQVVAAYSAALPLGPSNQDTLLMKWASAILIGSSARDALSASVKLQVPRFNIYRSLCDVLERNDCLTESVECFRQMSQELGPDVSNRERAEWELGFRGRCSEKLVKLGDAASDVKKHDEAIRCYSTALSLGPTDFYNIRLKRSKELIKLNPSSHEGYEEKHAVLNDMGRYGEAFEAFRAMLAKLEGSPDPKIRELHHQYIDVTPDIQKAVEEAMRHLPAVLIDTVSGRLYDKAQQAAAFEELPIYDKLRSSMTTGLNYPRIRTEVENFYRYVMLSHKWQPGEPTFQQVENTSLYELPCSPTFDKLRNFCELVAALGFKWAWSDTCCVNRLDGGVQQESIVAMFRWYRCSSLTIVHLLGVQSELQEAGCLLRSIWNTRGWTYQEYVASEVVQFYTEDWKPYLGLEVFNHKESPEVLEEMEQATKITTQQLTTLLLQPGLDRAREKLYLASRRKTTREEDMAYSLFGIFNVALPVVYGEGNQAVGRLLEHILTRLDDVTLLAWTGLSGSSHSYLPAELTVYDQIEPPHIPEPITEDEMVKMVTALRISFPDLSPVVTLFERLDLPPLSLIAGRLRLPGVAFPLADLTRLPRSKSHLRLYRATTPMLGEVEIETRDDLSEMEGLVLVHPWIGPLLDRDFEHGVTRFDPTARALRLVVRLRQPFGALLLAPSKRAQYKRVATDALIMARVREETLLTDLMDGIRTMDIQ